MGIGCSIFGHNYTTVGQRQQFDGHTYTVLVCSQCDGNLLERIDPVTIRRKR
jgi:hypothetical protein